jgi:hypothetical protein
MEETKVEKIAKMITALSKIILAIAALITAIKL